MMDQQKNDYEVLVLEDEISLKEAINTKLVNAGFHTAIFDNGRLALEDIEKRGHHYDGIWLDFDILEINGLEFMKKYITIDGWEKCPVLIVSNTGDPSLIKQAIDLGAKEWIIKAEVRLDDTVTKFVELINASKENS